MRKTISDPNVCFLCGRPGYSGDPLDEHHIFGGPFRKKSDKLGLTAPLHHYSCHICGSDAAHNNRETMLFIKRYGQRHLMKNGWTKEQFIREFGKNYIYDEEEEK